jgi:hypothetical protein
MSSNIALCVVHLDSALLWKDDLESNTPRKIKASIDNPDYKKEHDRNESGRDRTSMSSHFLKILLEELRSSKKFILIGSGSGKANAAEVLVDYIEEESPHTASNLIGLIKADVNNMTDSELLKLGRERWNEFLNSGK